jgi:hypothetical protein
MYERNEFAITLPLHAWHIQCPNLHWANTHGSTRHRGAIVDHEDEPGLAVCSLLTERVGSSRKAPRSLRPFDTEIDFPGAVGIEKSIHGEM